MSCSVYLEVKVAWPQALAALSGLFRPWIAVARWMNAPMRRGTSRVGEKYYSWSINEAQVNARHLTREKASSAVLTDSQSWSLQMSWSFRCLPPLQALALQNAGNLDVNAIFPKSWRAWWDPAVFWCILRISCFSSGTRMSRWNCPQWGHLCSCWGRVLLGLHTKNGYATTGKDDNQKQIKIFKIPNASICSWRFWWARLLCQDRGQSGPAWTAWHSTARIVYDMKQT
jgi:hypothetical protein